jgi:hypothetical protein
VGEENITPIRPDVTVRPFAKPAAATRPSHLRLVVDNDNGVRS